MRWLFSQFPEVSPEQVYNPCFWNLAHKKLQESSRSGESSLTKVMYWASQIKSVLKSRLKLGKQPLFPSSPCFPAPSPFPSAARPKAGILRRASRSSQAQGVHHSPGSPQNSQSPCPKSPGQTLRGSFPSPSFPLFIFTIYHSILTTINGTIKERLNRTNNINKTSCTTYT